MRPITKAVFPVAGMGTRFLPATKANPKEMLPIVDKPLIQYAVEEAIAAGITQLIFVTNSSKRAIEDHFDTNFELEHHLRQQGNVKLLDRIQNIVPKGVDCIYIRQSAALGLGHAVLCAKQVIGDEPFAVLLADDLIDAQHQPCLKQMLKLYQETDASVIAVQKIASADADKYGVIEIDSNFKKSGMITGIVEKPFPENAPSNYGVVGRYILSPAIFKFLKDIAKTPNQEIQLTDAIAQLLVHEKVYALQFQGQRFDCGTKLGYLQATLAFGLKHPDLEGPLKAYLHQIIDKEHNLVPEI